VVLLSSHLLSVSVAALVLLVAGCASSSGDDASKANALKPIDRVGEGIVDLRDDLRHTADASESISSDPSSRATFSRSLRSTERRAQTLRADAAELRDRAADYLALWSGQTYTVASNSHAAGTDDRRQIVKQKYDQFVSEMIAAKETVLPLLDEFRAIESSRDANAISPGVHNARQKTEQATASLSDALRSLDELKELVQPR
jgi:hypothetical protein